MPGLDQTRTVGLVTLAYVGMSSVSQPIFGLLADRWGTRFTGLALVWTAATFAAATAHPNGSASPGAVPGSGERVPPADQPGRCHLQ